MKYKPRQIKAMARESLHGKYGIVIAALLFFGMINIFINFLTTVLFQDRGIFSLIVSYIFSFILSLIMCIFTAGLDYIYLNIARHKETRPLDLFHMFNQHPDRVIIAGLAITVVSTIASLPILLMPDHLLVDIQNGSMDAFAVSMGIIFLSLILNTVLCIPFVFTYFLLADSPDMGAKDALKGSLQMAGKNFARILYLEISFIGLAVLSVFTLYIALLWIIPYIQTSLATLYMECKGELATSPAPGSVPNNGSSAIPSPSVPASKAEDDYNSEA